MATRSYRLTDEQRELIICLTKNADADLNVLLGNNTNTSRNVVNALHAHGDKMTKIREALSPAKYVF